MKMDLVAACEMSISDLPPILLKASDKFMFVNFLGEPFFALPFSMCVRDVKRHKRHLTFKWVHNDKTIGQQRPLYCLLVMVAICWWMASKDVWLAQRWDTVQIPLVGGQSILGILCDIPCAKV